MPYEIPDPFHEGQSAYVLGITRDQCPYSPRSVEQAAWLEGWDDAKAIYEEGLSDRSAGSEPR